MASDVERVEEEEESASELLRDRFRLCTIAIAEAEGFNTLYNQFFIYLLLELLCYLDEVLV